MMLVLTTSNRYFGWEAQLTGHHPRTAGSNLAVTRSLGKIEVRPHQPRESDLLALAAGDRPLDVGSLTTRCLISRADAISIPAGNRPKFNGNQRAEAEASRPWSVGWIGRVSWLGALRSGRSEWL
jgi:hypothetical protein